VHSKGSARRDSSSRRNGELDASTIGKCDVGVFMSGDRWHPSYSPQRRKETH
jgi:hypothetical protein